MLLPGDERARRRALHRWQQAAGPFAPLVSLTPFLADLGPLAPPELPAAVWAAPLADALLDEAAHGRPLAIVDRPALEALAAAPLLTRRRIAVVPVMRRWPFPNGLLPAAPLLGALLALARDLQRVRSWRAAVLLVESERVLTVPPPPDIGLPPEPLRTALDNRYGLDSLDVPQPAWLRAVGVERVLAVTAAEEQDGGAPPPPAPDVAYWLAQLAREGLATGLLPL